MFHVAAVSSENYCGRRELYDHVPKFTRYQNDQKIRWRYNQEVQRMFPTDDSDHAYASDEGNYLSNIGMSYYTKHETYGNRQY